MHTKAKKVAIVYDRVNKWGGAERVLLSLHELFPNADLFTSVYDKKGAPWASSFKNVKTSFVQYIPLAKRNHEYFALLMPMAFESFNFSTYDVVISVTSEAAKGVITGPDTLHLCYCLTPTRYLWSGRKTYFDSALKRAITKPALTYLRNWDRTASGRPDKMIGISTEVKKRIQRYYGRESALIFPPVETELFINTKKRKGEYFLLVSRLVGYKKVSLAVKTFNQIGEKLIIVGTGRQERHLKSIANRNIEFRGTVSDQELAKLYAGAKALIFPQHEDFGLVSLEAQAAGTPVIAYKKGGSQDTVKDKKTGLLFNKQTITSLTRAIQSFNERDFNPKVLKNHAKQFEKKRFLDEFATMLSSL